MKPFLCFCMPVPKLPLLQFWVRTHPEDYIMTSVKALSSHLAPHLRSWDYDLNIWGQFRQYHHPSVMVINSLKMSLFYFNYMYGRGTCMRVQVPSRSEGGVGTLVLELEAVMSCLTRVLGNESKPSARAVCTLYCDVISPALLT